MRTREKIVLLITLAVLLLLPMVAEATGNSFYIRLAARILILALAAVSLDLILGFGGMVSFGHAAFVGLGGYVVGIMFYHDFNAEPILGLDATQSFLAILAMAAVVSAMFALVIGAICLRTRGISFIMITLAFAQMLYFLMVAARKYGGEDGLALWNRNEMPGGVVDLHDHAVFYFVCLGLLLAFLFIGYRVVHSRFGRVLRGAKDNERRMTALGFPVYRYRLAAFVIAGAAAGVSGALLANYTMFVGPSYLSWTQSGELIVMVVLGGIGTLFGPVFGAAAFVLLEEFIPEILNHVRDGWGEHWQILLGPILLFIVLFARNGLYGALRGQTGGPMLAPDLTGADLTEPDRPKDADVSVEPATDTGRPV
ncbi:branched-chain amino acid ABC transporter permease [Fodinicurvata sp. EGI_FJ10296]|uniref:branched-chain amino acid ABC transporter permease n=1 Tax=Fodinicurvata sp. EGI_FJ10296 TaxID=3231908 RepID=UPI003454D760